MHAVANKFAILVVVHIALSLAVVVVVLAFVRIPSLFTQNIAYMPCMQAQCYAHIVHTKSL